MKGKYQVFLRSNLKLLDPAVGTGIPIPWDPSPNPKFWDWDWDWDRFFRILGLGLGSIFQNFGIGIDFCPQAIRFARGDRFTKIP